MFSVSYKHLLILGMLVLLPGCRREDPIEARIRSTRAAVSAKADASSPVKAKLLRQVLADLSRASPETLKTPQLSAAVLWGGNDEPLAEFWWIEDSPSVDGLVFRWNGNPGTYLKIPQGILDGTVKDSRESGLVCHASGISLGPYLKNGLRLPDSGIEAALTRSGKKVSSFIQCPSLLAKEGEATSRPTHR